MRENAYYVCFNGYLCIETSIFTARGVARQSIRGVILIELSSMADVTNKLI